VCACVCVCERECVCVQTAEGCGGLRRALITCTSWEGETNIYVYIYQYTYIYILHANGCTWLHLSQLFRSGEGVLMTEGAVEEVVVHTGNTPEKIAEYEKIYDYSLIGVN
jgi:hypothetical protein